MCKVGSRANYQIIGDRFIKILDDLESRKAEDEALAERLAELPTPSASLPLACSPDPPIWHISATPRTGAVSKDLRITDPRDDKRRIEETKGGLLRIHIAGSSKIPTSNNGKTSNRANYSGSGVIPVRARRCYFAV